MSLTNRYMVWWESSITGEHRETRDDEDEAVALLRKREQRAFFERGVVVDLAEHQPPEQEIAQQHEQFVSSRV